MPNPSSRSLVLTSALLAQLVALGDARAQERPTAAPPTPTQRAALTVHGFYVEPTAQMGMSFHYGYNTMVLTCH